MCTRPRSAAVSYMQEKRGAINEILERPIAFAVVFLVLFAITCGFLALADALPEPLPSQTATSTPEQVEAPATREQPTRVVADSVGLDVTVSNPDTTDVAALDQELLKGAVRYPTSALLGETGTVLLFGHSSYLPVVHNQAYKAFNRIQNLKTGDMVSVYAGETEYRYAVSAVRLADANEDGIALSTDGKRLVLVTCNSFATKSDRFVVTAEFKGVFR